MSTQHRGLSPERWNGFSRSQQILMIANEAVRAFRLTSPADLARRRSSLERVLALVDLTVTCQSSRSLRRELLRWRDLVAAAYLADVTDRSADRARLRALLSIDREAYRQIAALGLA